MGSPFLVAYLYFLSAPLNIITGPWFGDILAGIEIFLAINLLIVVSLLVYVYRHANSPGVRSKIRIVVLGGALSLMAFVQLSILPDALLHQPIIPYTFAFLLLCIIPLTYGYAIFRHRLIEIEKHINRGATIILVYTLLGCDVSDPVFAHQPLDTADACRWSAGP